MLTVVSLLGLFTVTQGQTLCVWGNNISPEVAGVYTYTSQDENYNRYWTRTNNNDSNCNDPYYIKKYDRPDISYYGPWQIRNDSKVFYEPRVRNSNPWDCYDWQQYNGTHQVIDSNMDMFTVQSDCPEWNCIGIQVTFSSNPLCNGIFYKVDGISHAYKKPQANYWIYFASFQGYWVCNDKLKPNSCFSNYLAKSDPIWTLLQPGETVPNTVTLGDITCLGTRMPTSNPTTQPSAVPSTSPTSSTTYPTSVPSVNPTTNPSSYPSDIPSGNPSIDPTTGPTITPSLESEDITDPSGNGVNTLMVNHWNFIWIVMVVAMIG
eukprot:768716_1